MPTLQTPPAPAGLPPGAETANRALSAEQALVPSPHLGGRAEVVGPASPLARLPVELEVAVPVRDFRVRNLLALEPNIVIETQWGHAEDVPLGSGNVQLAWSEFEVVETQLAVRVTRLA